MITLTRICSYSYEYIVQRYAVIKSKCHDHKNATVSSMNSYTAPKTREETTTRGLAYTTGTDCEWPIAPRPNCVARLTYVAKFGTFDPGSPVKKFTEVPTDEEQVWLANSMPSQRWQNSTWSCRRWPYTPAISRPEWNVTSKSIKSNKPLVLSHPQKR